MCNWSKLNDYIFDKYYCVIYEPNYCYSCTDYGQKIEGILLNYNSGNIVLLSEHGIYHIKYKDIIFMKPIEPPMDKLSKEFKKFLKTN